MSLIQVTQNKALYGNILSKVLLALYHNYRLYVTEEGYVMRPKDG